MSTGDDLLDDMDGPSTEEIVRVVERALRRYGHAPQPMDDDTAGTGPSDEELLDSLTKAFRRCGLIPSPTPVGKRHHPLTSAGLNLKDLRSRSGWTTEEIAERTGTSLDLLTAFENGDSAAAAELTSSDLERFASACGGTLADLLGSDHPWVKAARRRYLGDSDIGGCYIDPCG